MSSSGTIKNDFGKTPLEVFNECNSKPLNERSSECADYNYFFPKFEIQLYHKKDGLLEKVIDKKNVKVSCKARNSDNTIVKDITVSPFSNEISDGKRVLLHPYAFELVSSTDDETKNIAFIHNLYFEVENNGNKSIDEAKLLIYTNDLTENPLQILDSPNMTYDKKKMDKRSLDVDVTLVPTKGRWAASNKVNRISLLDSNNSTLGSYSFTTPDFPRGKGATVNATFQDINIKSKIRKIQINVGNDGIELWSMSAKFKNDDGSIYENVFNDNNGKGLRKWVKSGRFTLDLGKSVNVPEKELTDEKNINFEFIINDALVNVDESFVVYPFGKRNMSNNMRKRVINTKMTPVFESFSTNGLSYSNFSVNDKNAQPTVEGFTDSTMNQNNSELESIYKDVVKMRSDLDSDVAELNKEKNTIWEENKKMYDRTMFGGIVSTIIATSLLYYVFVEL